LKDGSNASSAATFAGSSHEVMLAPSENSDFQILAHFAKRKTSGIFAHVGGSASELAAEGIGKVAVAGKPDFEGECRKIVGTALNSLERSPETQPDQIVMNGDAGLLMNDAGEMKRRRMNRVSNVVKGDRLAQAACEPSLGVDPFEKNTA
jgi:hypothetical protein